MLGVTVLSSGLAMPKVRTARRSGFNLLRNFCYPFARAIDCIAGQFLKPCIEAGVAVQRKPLLRQRPDWLVRSGLLQMPLKPILGLAEVHEQYAPKQLLLLPTPL